MDKKRVGFIAAAAAAVALIFWPKPAHAAQAPSPGVPVPGPAPSPHQDPVVIPPASDDPENDPGSIWTDPSLLPGGNMPPGGFNPNMGGHTAALPTDPPGTVARVVDPLTNMETPVDASGMPTGLPAQHGVSSFPVQPATTVGGPFTGSTDDAAGTSPTPAPDPEPWTLGDWGF